MSKKFAGRTWLGMLYVPVLTLGLGVACKSAPVAAGGPIAGSAGSEYRVLAPIQSGDLTLFPVVRADGKAGAGDAFLTLDEGLRSGDVGEGAANAIPTDARASIDFRLVPDQTPERVREKTEAFLRAQGWYVVTDEPDMATRVAHPKVIRAQWSLDYPAYLADMTAPAVKAVVASIARSTGAPVLQMPMLGGSVPMYTFAAALHMPIVGVPLANADNNQHGANENLRLQNLWDGIEIYAGLLTDLNW